jgi:hypothetical protein
MIAATIQVAYALHARRDQIASQILKTIASGPVAKAGIAARLLRA